MLKYFGFPISTVLLAILVVVLALGWIADRRQLSDRIQSLNHPISNLYEKLELWSPAGYLQTDTDSCESKLVDVIDFKGNKVVSSQGAAEVTLRQPTIETLNKTLTLLDANDLATRISAARLLALYMQAVSGSENLDPDSMTTRVHFQAVGLPKIRQLLADSDPDIRGASALILGNSLYDRRTLELLKRTFDEEHDETVKCHLAWAYWKIEHNYDKAEFYVKRHH